MSTINRRLMMVSLIVIIALGVGGWWWQTQHSGSLAIDPATQTALVLASRGAVTACQTLAVDAPAAAWENCLHSLQPVLNSPVPCVADSTETACRVKEVLGQINDLRQELSLLQANQ